MRPPLLQRSNASLPTPAWALRTSASAPSVTPSLSRGCVPVGGHGPRRKARCASSSRASAAGGPPDVRPSSQAAISPTRHRREGCGMSSDSVAADQLRAFVERLERMHEERKAIADDIREIYAEAKG